MAAVPSIAFLASNVQRTSSLSGRGPAAPPVCEALPRKPRQSACKLTAGAPRHRENRKSHPRRRLIIVIPLLSSLDLGDSFSQRSFVDREQFGVGYRARVKAGGPLLVRLLGQDRQDGRGDTTLGQRPRQTRGTH